MNAAGDTNREIREILSKARTVAVVGMSNNPARASFEVGAYLARQGYRVLPVNPTIDVALGVPTYKNLREIGEHIDVVDIFRRPDAVDSVVDDAIAIGADVVWMQQGIVNEAAAARARQAGLKVVMDRCMLTDHRRLLGQSAPGDSSLP